VFHSEVSLPIVDHVVKTDPPHHLELRRAVDVGHLNVLQLGELDGNRTDAAARPLIRIF
jgi:hypothetical protein